MVLPTYPLFYPVYIWTTTTYMYTKLRNLYFSQEAYYSDTVSYNTTNKIRPKGFLASPFSVQSAKVGLCISQLFAQNLELPKLVSMQVVVGNVGEILMASDRLLERLCFEKHIREHCQDSSSLPNFIQTQNNFRNVELVLNQRVI